jgi:NAD(P)-dependent dehydrogenase (short-subunit alcohol dehydrogenase family)
MIIMKTAIVTGASGNLGQAVVTKFIQEGFYVVGTIVPNDPVQLSFPSAQFEAVEVNLMDEEAAATFIAAVIAKHSSIDVAVLTVGGFAMGSIATTTASDIMKQYKLNFETAYHVARPTFIQMMQQNSGRIFMIGSKPGLSATNGKDMIAYGLAKSLLFRLAELMNNEAKAHNVVTSVVIPSTIDTPQNRKAMPDAHFANWVKPESIADIIYFYCTDTASVIREPVIKVYNQS